MTNQININLKVILEILMFQHIRILIINKKIKILDNIYKMIKFMMRKNTWVLKVKVKAAITVKEKSLKLIIQLKKGKISKMIFWNNLKIRVLALEIKIMKI